MALDEHHEDEVLPGRGVTGRIGDRSYWLGSHRFLEQRGEESAEQHALAERLESGGRTVVVIGSDRHVCGMIALADAIRPEAVAALRSLRSAGIGRIVMLTGGNRTTAERIALGIKLLFAALACVGVASLWGAIVADMGASLLVVGNGLRMLRPHRAADAIEPSHGATTSKPGRSLSSAR